MQYGQHCIPTLFALSSLLGQLYHRCLLVQLHTSTRKMLQMTTDKTAISMIHRECPSTRLGVLPLGQEDSSQRAKIKRNAETLRLQ
jgi:hypothetical protein